MARVDVLPPKDRDRVFSDATWAHMAREFLAEAGIAATATTTGWWVVARHGDDPVHRRDPRA